MVDKEDYIEELYKLKEIPEENTERQKIAAGIIADYVKKAYGIDLVVVGGLSVEIYTDGGYMTQDIDYVGVNHEKIMQALVDLGFERVGKDSKNEDLRIYVEVPGSVLDGSEDRVQKVFVNDRYKLSVIGIDDILIDRLRALVSVNEYIQEKWIFRLMQKHFDTIDIAYIKSKLTDAEEDKFEEFLDLFKRENEYARKQFELTKELDELEVPYSSYKIDELEILSLPTSDGEHYGLSLFPIIMGYTYEEDDEGEDTFFTIKEEACTMEELVRWIESIPDNRLTRKKELLQALDNIGG